MKWVEVCIWYEISDVVLKECQFVGSGRKWKVDASRLGCKQFVSL
jgi:hypothetical protein